MPDLTDRETGTETPGAKFKIFVPMMKAMRADDGEMVLSGIASSTVTDLHGDLMTASALDDMLAAARQNLTIFLNHSYRVPEDVAGSVRSASLKRDADIVDLSFDRIVVNKANARAIEAFESVEGGTKLGLSIGAQIPEGGAHYDKTKKGWVIEHVLLMETSIVSLPANPRSWVDYAVKAMSGHYPDQFANIVKAKGLEGISKDLTPWLQDDIDAEGIDPEAIPAVESAAAIALRMSGTMPPVALVTVGDPPADANFLNPVAAAAVLDLEKSDGQHPHAHEHDHEHTHGYGSTELVHSHDHFHMHSHEHDADHEHSSAASDKYQHDHWHNTGDDVHEHDNGVDAGVSGVYDSVETMKESHPELPDAAFACLDSTGRHYPHHNADGAVNKALLRNALARIGDPANTQCGKAHLERHAKALGIGQEKSDEPEVFCENEFVHLDDETVVRAIDYNLDHGDAPILILSEAIEGPMVAVEVTGDQTASITVREDGSTEVSVQDAPPSNPDPMESAIATMDEAALMRLLDTGSLSIETATEVVRVLASELSVAKAATVEAEAQRDQALEMAQRVIEGTGVILAKLSSLPTGRRAVAKQVNESFEHLAGYYTDDVMSILRSK